jgi:hypothetical protein
MRRPSLTTVHWAAVAAFALLAILQLVPMLMEHPGRGYTLAVLPVVGMLVGLWASAALGLFMKKAWGYVAAIVGSLAAIGHGGALRLGEDPLGVAFLLLGFASFALVVSDRRVMGFRAAGTRPSLA